ncbi:MAG: TonB-dependent receptor, partial [Deltaproteobacteria bacterium]
MLKSIHMLMISFLVLMPLPAAGQEEVELEPVVVTASRIEEPLSQVSSSITVITAEDIESQRAVTVEEVLRNVPGLDVQTQGSLGDQVVVRLRGAEIEHTLVLIDGIKVNSPFFAFYDFGDLLAENIERIEIVRGAQSALYGSEAIGGVINIITKKGKGKSKFAILTEGGNNSTFREMAALRGENDICDYSLSGSRTNSDGEVFNDVFRENSFSGRLNIGKSDNNSLQLIARYLDSEKELPLDIIQFGPDDFQLLNDKNRMVERKLLANSIAYQQVFNPWWDVILHVSFVNSEVTENNPDIGDIGVNSMPPNNIEQSFDCTQRTMEIQNNFYISELNVLSLGFQAQS